MRKQRLMGVSLVMISWFVLLLALTGATPIDQDATAALLTLPLGLYMIFSEEYILYDGEPLEPESCADRRKREAELDPWAPTSPGAAIDPLFPWSLWGLMEGHTTNTDIKKGADHGKKARYRGTEPQILGGRERRPPADRRGPDRAG